MDRCRLFIASLLLSVLVLAPFAATVQAQSSEEKFQDIFITAGYATAFGAALGAASLSFFAEPASHLRLIAIGASLGFIGGSILGSYVVFAPVVGTVDPMSTDTLLTSGHVPERGLALRPAIDLTTRKLTSLEGAITLANF